MQPRWARAGGPGTLGASLGSSAPPLPPPQPRGSGAGAGGTGCAELLPDFAGLAGGRAGAFARTEENGVECTYLSEFGAHQDEEEEAEELPGRLHVSLPPPTSWHAGAWARRRRRRQRGGGDADALPALLAPRRHLVESPCLQHPEPEARGICCAEPPLCILMGPSSAAPGGAGRQGGAGRAALRAPPPAAPRAPLGGAARRRVPKVCW